MLLETAIIGLAVLLVVLAILHKYLTSTFNYFEKQGISGPRPVPIFGTWWNSWNKSPAEEELANVKKFGKIYGTFNGRTPNLVVADLDLVKSIMGKDKGNFTNIAPTASKQDVLQTSMFYMSNDEEKKIRDALSPVLVNDKWKRLVPHIQKTAKLMTKDLQKALEPVGQANITKLASSYILDTLALIIFGIELDSSQNPDHPFVVNTNKIFSNQHPDSPFALLPIIFPSFASHDNIVVGKAVSKYFTDLCYSIIQERRKQGDDIPTKNDLVDVLLETAEEEKKGTIIGPEEEKKKDVDKEVLLTDEVIATQLLTALLTGYTTTRNQIALAVHTLATNSEIQERLHMELVNYFDDSKDKEPSFELMQNLGYLHFIVKEVLRMFPAKYRLNRQCNTTTEYDNVKIEEGTSVSIAAYAIHHNEEIFPEPETISPDRFVDNIEVPYTYMPFGHGLRNCIGDIFCCVVTKLTLAYLVRDFKFTSCDETKNPPVLKKGITNILSPEDIIVGVELRN